MQTSSNSGTALGKMVTSQYGSGSWTGAVYDDTVSVSGLPAVTDAFVAIDSQSTFFGDQNCVVGGAADPNQNQGIMGFAFSGQAVSNTVGYMDELTSSGAVANLFATSLCETGGTLWIGGYDSSVMSGTLQYTPLKTASYYTINVSDMMIGGTSIGLSETSYGSPIVDTGSSVGELPTAVYNGLKSLIQANTTFVNNFGSDFFDGQDGCLTSATGATTAELNATLPQLEITFPTASGATFSISLPATESYLDIHEQVSGQTTYCAGFVPESAGVSILGAPFLRSVITVFDRANKQVGFVSSTACAS